MELEQGGSEANGFWGRIAVLGNREPFEVPHSATMPLLERYSGDFWRWILKQIKLSIDLQFRPGIRDNFHELYNPSNSINYIHIIGGSLEVKLPTI